MAKEKKQSSKMILEREYVVPLRKGWLKVAQYKRANKAVKTLKEFIARHMKIYDRDLRRIKLDIYLNNEIRFRGMRKPPAKIKVKAKKFNDNTVRVELAQVPKPVEYLKKKHEKFKSIGGKIEEKKEDEKKKEKKEIKITDKEKEKTEIPVEIKEKEEAAKEESMKIAKEQAKESKHVSKVKEPTYHRTALRK